MPLFPTFDPPPLVQSAPNARPKYGKSLRFDFESGDFVLDGAGRLEKLDGHAAWVQWCQMAVLTERFAYPIYSTNFGTEMLKAKKQPTRAAVQAWIEREITEALLVNPRTDSVRDFSFSWSGDELYVTFTAVPVIGPSVQLEVTV